MGCVDKIVRVLVVLLAGCASLPPAPLASARTNGDADGDGRVIWWSGQLEYTCTSTNPADGGALMHVYLYEPSGWSLLSGDGGRTPRLVRPGREDLSFTNLDRIRDGTPILLVATFLGADLRVTDAECALVSR